jgi:hypothetical protein
MQSTAATAFDDEAFGPFETGDDINANDDTDTVEGDVGSPEGLVAASIGTACRAERMELGPQVPRGVQARCGHGRPRAQRRHPRLRRDSRPVRWDDQSSRLEVGGDLHDLVIGPADAHAMVMNIPASGRTTTMPGSVVAAGALEVDAVALAPVVAEQGDVGT